MAADPQADLWPLLHSLNIKTKLETGNWGQEAPLKVRSAELLSRCAPKKEFRVRTFFNSTFAQFFFTIAHWPDEGHDTDNKGCQEGTDNPQPIQGTQAATFNFSHE